jgi:hypothetical protein|tara:strand:- start:10564 stop:10791 length:228 start_codon:yes stop_codon:yes gene_type:complete
MKVSKSVYESLRLNRKDDRPIKVDITRSCYTWDNPDLTFKCAGIKVDFSCSIEALEEFAKKLLFIAALEYKREED